MMRIQSDTVSGRCLRLGGALAGVWLLALAPSFGWFGLDGIIAVTVSALACLVPGCLVFRLVAGVAPPVAQTRAVLLGTGLRIVFGLLGAILMHEILGLGVRNYVIWLTVFYLVALLVETYLIMPVRMRVRTG